ncbi:unnamed protein product [Linum trigynum]|uniref:Uncharacterized protein n=1 Tax=Linum trigynum TaxID=586398 RepID=A0AAV2EE43_9ROSI
MDQEWGGSGQVGSMRVHMPALPRLRDGSNPHQNRPDRSGKTDQVEIVIPDNRVGYSACIYQMKWLKPRTYLDG